MDIVYEEFAKLFTEHMEKVLATEGISVERTSVTKTNSQNYDGLRLSRADSNVSPQLYFDSFWLGYLDGRDMAELVAEGCKLAKESMRAKIELPDFSSKQTRKNLFIEVINAAVNSDLLENTPHRLINDEIAVIARLRMDIAEGESGTCIVKESMLPMFKLTKDELLDTAIANTQKKGFRCTSMIDTIKELMNGLEDVGLEDVVLDELFPEDSRMYVVTNSEKNWGAAVLACKSELTRITEQIGEACVVIPASRHEVILLPESSVPSLEQIEEMVREVNREQVAPEDFLSDTVFHFSPVTKKLSVAAEISDTETKETKIKRTMKI